MALVVTITSAMMIQITMTTTMMMVVASCLWL